jgi:eukaryotic-like serine/threonine-protein kinase
MRTPNQLAAAVVDGFSALPALLRRRGPLHPTVLGPYTLERKLGEGGMGSVWRAHHALLERKAAVKLIGRGGDDVAARRFEREARLTARLNHPNAITVYDFGRTHDGTLWFAMELVDGPDLDHYVGQHGPLEPARVARLLAQLSGALAEVHDLGLVHRDVKPSNVLLSHRRDDEDVAKLADFGLVKNVAEAADVSRLTAKSAITGSPMFMSPEAILTPDAVDARSDLYSLGMLGWFLLVGRAPFEGNVIEVCSHHLHSRPVRPSVALRRAVPSGLEEAILACIEKHPEDRPADARTLRRLLERSG